MSNVLLHPLAHSSSPPDSENEARILIVHGDSVRRAALAEVLRVRGNEIITLETCATLFWTLDEFAPDLVILDSELAGERFERCREIREHLLGGHAALLLVCDTAPHDERVAVGLLAGADDFFYSPSRALEFKARCAVQIRNKRQRDALRRIRSERDNLRRDIQLDPLTGALNRRSMDRLLAARLKSQTSCAVLFLDIDHFKGLNDDFGHDVGDQVLKSFCGVLQNGMRRGDEVGRWGGEEFVMVLEVGTPELALQVAERHREHVENMHRDLNLPRQVTVSIGLALFSPGSEEPVDALVRRADAALYQAKRSGRNCVRVAEPTLRLKSENHHARGLSPEKNAGYLGLSAGLDHLEPNVMQQFAKLV